jgi:hypothetical protein
MEDVHIEFSGNIDPFFSQINTSSFIFRYCEETEEQEEDPEDEEKEEQEESPPSGGGNPSKPVKPNTIPDKEEQDDTNQTTFTNETTNITTIPDMPMVSEENNQTDNATLVVTPPKNISGAVEKQNLGGHPSFVLGFSELPFLVYLLGILCIIGGGMSMIRLKIRNKPVVFDEHQAEILELISLAKQNMGDHKLAWRYYQEAREKLIAHSDTIRRKQYTSVQNQLIEVYSMLLLF